MVSLLKSSSLRSWQTSGQEHSLNLLHFVNAAVANTSSLVIIPGWFGVSKTAWMKGAGATQFFNIGNESRYGDIAYDDRREKYLFVVKADTLEASLTKLPYAKYDIVQIDCEGFDPFVMKQLLGLAWRPSLMAIVTS